MRTRAAEASVLEGIVRGIPRIANALEELPLDELWPAIAAVEESYKNTLRQSGFSKSVSDALAAAIIRRLKGHLAADGLTETEIMQKLCEDLTALGEVAPVS